MIELEEYLAGLKDLRAHIARLERKALNLEDKYLGSGYQVMSFIELLMKANSHLFNLEAKAIKEKKIQKTSPKANCDLGLPDF